MNQRENTPAQEPRGERAPQAEPLPLVIVTER
jgi:hypothetical protein